MIRSVTCSECLDHVSHCHGTLIVDTVGVECTDPACADLDMARHALVVARTLTPA
ncbi:hypothetical protein [Actinokineospora xionganensis]|uniref:SR1 protein n=1 Tax=Actinokineospora xionganensis TaxID=2684470 RepID=A0ABR7L588_9PSEU|nr:hypothetical protein [Actinokineospora xionganensis]MBC6447854.1 hypothetical protein [Actinokineospora xionganensis]